MALFSHTQHERIMDIQVESIIKLQIYVID